MRTSPRMGQPLTASAAVEPFSVAGARSRLTRTPARLRLAATLLAITAIVFGVVATTAATSRRNAANSVASSSEPQLTRAEGIYAALSDADATAATTFLTGGIGNAASRKQYLRDLAAASSQLAALSRHAGNSSDIRAAAATLATQLPVYSGLVEAARSNNRQGFPVGAAYLRQASVLMRTRMLPAAEQLYVVEAQRTNADYRKGTRNIGLIASFVAGGLLLVLLLVTQLGLARFSKRRLNISLLVATGLALLALLAVSALIDEQNSLAAAQREGSDSVQLLSTARFLALRAQRDDSLALIGRGSDTASLPDFNKTIQALRGSGAGGGVLGEAERAARRSGTAAAVADVRAALQPFEAAHRRVAALEQRGDYRRAVDAYIHSEVPQAEALDAKLEAQTRAAQQRFAGNADDATSAIDVAPVALALFALAIAGFAIHGLAVRLKEYR